MKDAYQGEIISFDGILHDYVVINDIKYNPKYFNMPVVFDGDGNVTWFEGNYYDYQNYMKNFFGQEQNNSYKHSKLLF